MCPDWWHMEPTWPRSISSLRLQEAELQAAVDKANEAEARAVEAEARMKEAKVRPTQGTKGTTWVVGSSTTVEGHGHTPMP